MNTKYTDGIYCIVCLSEAFTHDPADPHLIHHEGCGVEISKAVTVYDGQALCEDDLILRLLAELPAQT